MNTPRQIFQAAYKEALRKVGYDKPVQKVLSRLDVYELQQIRDELAEQFHVWFINVCETVDVGHSGPTIGGRSDHLQKMRTVGEAPKLNGSEEPDNNA